MSAAIAVDAENERSDGVFVARAYLEIIDLEATPTRWSLQSSRQQEQPCRSTSYWILTTYPFLFGATSENPQN